MNKGSWYKNNTLRKFSEGWQDDIYIAENEFKTLLRQYGKAFKKDYYYGYGEAEVGLSFKLLGHKVIITYLEGEFPPACTLTIEGLGRDSLEYDMDINKFENLLQAKNDQDILAILNGVY